MNVKMEGIQMKQELVKINRMDFHMKQLRVKNIAAVIADIFHKGKYIGFDNAIAQDDLFNEIFGKWQKPDDLADELRWEYARRAMHYLRQRTKCFIGSVYSEDKRRHYFVIKSEDDAQHYIGLLENCIKKMRFMQKRAMQSVDEELWKSVESGNAIPKREKFELELMKKEKNGKEKNGKKESN
jgi:hypothetical protein